jgi:hypothetical protein
MLKFDIRWTEHHRAIIEADNESQAIARHALDQSLAESLSETFKSESGTTIEEVRR